MRVGRVSTRQTQIWSTPRPLPPRLSKLAPHATTAAYHLVHNSERTLSRPSASRCKPSIADGQVPTGAIAAIGPPLDEVDLVTDPANAPTATVVTDPPHGTSSNTFLASS